MFLDENRELWIWPVLGCTGRGFFFEFGPTAFGMSALLGIRLTLSPTESKDKEEERNSSSGREDQKTTTAPVQDPDFEEARAQGLEYSRRAATNYVAGYLTQAAGAWEASGASFLKAGDRASALKSYTSAAKVQLRLWNYGAFRRLTRKIQDLIDPYTLPPEDIQFLVNVLCKMEGKALLYKPPEKLHRIFKKGGDLK
jgi:hypothetical protein